MQGSVLPTDFFMQQMKEGQMRQEVLKPPFQFLNLLLSESIISLRIKLKIVTCLQKADQMV